MGRHVVDIFGTDFLGRHEQVAFIFAILIVDHDDHLAGTNIGNDVFNIAE